MGTMAGISDTQQASEQKSLYDRDYYTWAMQQADALKRRDFDAVDWENVTEEIEALARGEESSLRSQYARVMEHLLKLQYRESRETQPVAGWEKSVMNGRREIQDVLEDNPGLKGHRDDLFDQAWPRARRNFIDDFASHATDGIQNDSMRHREKKRLTREWNQVVPQQNPFSRLQVETPFWLPERVRLAERPQSRHQPASKFDRSR